MLNKILGRGAKDREPQQSEPVVETQAAEQEQKLFDREQTTTIDVKGPRGSKATVTIHLFSAMVGWEIKRQMRQWVMADKADLNREFTEAVLAYASVNGQRLNNSETIDRLLMEWQNVKAVFHAVMDFNGIDTSGQDEITFDCMIVARNAATAFLTQFERILTNGEKE